MTALEPRIRVFDRADPADHAFVIGLSPRLAAVAELDWHPIADVLSFQRGYTADLLAEGGTACIALIAEDRVGCRLGFAIAQERADEITGEACCHLALLCLTEAAEGHGIAAALMRAVEAWAAAQGHRLMTLAVFANNSRGRAFYKRLGFFDDTLTMTRPLR